MSSALLSNAGFAPLDATQQELLLYDTGQIDTGQLDTGQARASRTAADAALAVTFHQIHRVDTSESGDREEVISTLKYFNLHVAVQDRAGNLVYNHDGTTLTARLLYESGDP